MPHLHRCRSWNPLTLALLSVIASAAAKAADEPTLRIQGRNGEDVALTQAELRELPRTEIEVEDRDGSLARFEGVNLSELLKLAGAPQGDKLRGEWMRAYVVVGAADDYEVVFALPEFDASFTDHKLILADTRNGEPLDANHGPFQIVVPHEKRHSRWVRMVTGIRIVDSLKAEPAPAVAND